MNLKDDPESSVIVETDEAGGSVRIGDGGINPNATDFEVRPDVDITVVSDSFVAGVGGPEMDRLGAQGGRGTGNPLTSRVSLLGGAGRTSSSAARGATGYRARPETTASSASAMATPSTPAPATTASTAVPARTGPAPVQPGGRHGGPRGPRPAARGRPDRGRRERGRDALRRCPARRRWTEHPQRGGRERHPRRRGRRRPAVGAAATTRSTSATAPPTVPTAGPRRTASRPILRGPTR